MAKLWMLLVAFLCVCSTGQAADPSEFTALVFWPRPLPSAASTAISPPSAAAQDATERRGLRPADDIVSRSDPLPTREALSDAVEKSLDSLSEEESSNGERSSALIDELMSLAALYEDLGRHTAAIAALEDAINIIRINYGLYSLEQVGAVESLIASRQANGDYDQASAQREYVRELVRRNADDPRVVSILSGLARSEMESAEELLGVPPPPQLSFQQGPPLRDFGVRAGLPLRPALAALYAARRDYAAALRVAAKTEAGNAGDLFALEDALIDTVYFEVAHPELHRRLGGPVVVGALGIGLFRAKVINSVNFERTAVDVAKAHIELGDWYLIFSANGAALDEYRAAREVLAQEDTAPEVVEALLSPAIPAVLPVLPADIDDSATTRAHRGYVDAAVELNRYGGARSIEILDASAGTPKAVERRLRGYVNRHRFRPRFVADDLDRSDRFRARFYYDY
jgi:tetratricopeptide (TPR) repeat protein